MRIATDILRKLTVAASLTTVVLVAAHAIETYLLAPNKGADHNENEGQ